VDAITQSPCVRNCCLNDRDECIGCGRSLEHIRLWGQYTSEQRSQVLAELKAKAINREAVADYLSLASD